MTLFDLSDIVNFRARFSLTKKHFYQFLILIVTDQDNLNFTPLLILISLSYSHLTVEALSLLSPVPPPLFPLLPPSLPVSLLPPSSFKSERGSGDIGKWDGRMFKLELVFISCLISWRLSPWLSAANPFDLSEACRREQRTRHTHTHTHTGYTHIYIPFLYTNFKSVTDKHILLKWMLKWMKLFINKQTMSEYIYIPLVSVSGYWVCHVSQRVCST